MKTQEEINKDWIQTYHSNVNNCECSYLVPPRRTDRPANLKGRYDYELPAERARSLVKAINAYLETLPNAFQYAGADSTPTKYGMRFNLFILSFRLGLIPDQPHKGITMLDWDLVAATIRLMMRMALNVPDVPLYVEPWIEERKFQARFETYIKFTEL